MGYYKNLSISGGARTQGVSQGNSAGISVRAEIDEEVYQMYVKALARLSVNNPAVRKILKDALRKEAAEARKRIMRDVRMSLSEDPRRAYLGVKRLVYKKALGFNVSILSQRKAGARYKLIRPRKLDQNPNQRGGNRRSRSDRTEQIDTYYGKDRAFILRFLNSGTDYRTTRFGNRGSLAARRMFEISATFQMHTAQDDISKIVEEILQEEFSEETR